MEQPQWDVLRCPQCGQCFGRESGKSARCLRCDRAADDLVKVVGHAENSHELQKRIATANLPEELRKTFRNRMKSPIGAIHQEEKGSQQACRVLKNAVDEEGEIHLLTLMKEAKKEYMEMGIEDIVSKAEGEGLILRLGEGHWAFLG